MNNYNQNIANRNQIIAITGVASSITTILLTILGLKFFGYMGSASGKGISNFCQTYIEYVNSLEYSTKKDITSKLTTDTILANHSVNLYLNTISKSINEDTLEGFTSVFDKGIKEIKELKLEPKETKETLISRLEYDKSADEVKSLDIIKMYNLDNNLKRDKIAKENVTLKINDTMKTFIDQIEKMHKADQKKEKK